MSTRAVALVRSFQNKLTAHSEIFVRVTFGVFMGGLVVLLIGSMPTFQSWALISLRLRRPLYLSIQRA